MEVLSSGSTCFASLTHCPIYSSSSSSFSSSSKHQPPLYPLLDIHFADVFLNGSASDWLFNLFYLVCFALLVVTHGSLPWGAGFASSFSFVHHSRAAPRAAPSPKRAGGKTRRGPSDPQVAGGGGSRRAPPPPEPGKGTPRAQGNPSRKSHRGGRAFMDVFFFFFNFTELLGL